MASCANLLAADHLLCLYLDWFGKPEKGTASHHKGLQILFKENHIVSERLLAGRAAAVHHIPRPYEHSASKMP